MLSPIRTPQAPGGFPDGIRPVFVEVGASPTAGNAPYPPGSVVRFGTLYYLNIGTLAVPSWTLLTSILGQSLTALTGIAKLTAGVFSAAAAGVDFSKGPWKTFSTVRNVAAAQTLSIPVVDGEGNGIVRATGRLLSDGTGRNITVKINGSAVNVSLQGLQGTGAATAASTAWLGGTSVYGAFFSLVMFTAKTANALKRFGVIQIVEANATIAAASYASGFHFKDSATTITSIDLDCGNATGFAANTEAMVEEGIVS